MFIHYLCAGCHQSLRVVEGSAGKIVKCPRCGTRQRLAEPAGSLSAGQSGTKNKAGAGLLDRPLGFRRKAPVPDRKGHVELSARSGPAAGTESLIEEPPDIWSQGLRDRTFERGLVRQFRRAAGWLGAWAIVIGIIGILLAMVLITRRDFGLGISHPTMVIVGFLELGLASLWLLAGILTCVKRQGAMYTVLVLAYFKLVSNGVGVLLAGGLSGLGVWIALAMIVQALKVIGLANRMERNGLALNSVAH